MQYYSTISLISRFLLMVLVSGCQPEEALPGWQWRLEPFYSQLSLSLFCSRFFSIFFSYKLYAILPAGFSLCCWPFFIGAMAIHILVAQLLAIVGLWLGLISATCYAPDGNVSPNDSPCLPDQVEEGGAGFCCSTGYACLSNRMCMKTSLVKPLHTFYRATCTDKTWNDPNCPNFCLSR